MNKELKKLLKQAEPYIKEIKGLDAKNNRHIRVHLNNGKVIVVSLNPKDQRFIKNVKQDFKRAGVVV